MELPHNISPRKGIKDMSKKIIQLNEGAIKEELSTLVRDTVEKTLNELLDQEADRLTNARRYERSEDRVDTRAGHYDRKLLTKAGEVMNTPE
jgi:putative transposase